VAGKTTEGMHQSHRWCTPPATPLS